MISGKPNNFAHRMVIALPLVNRRWLPARFKLSELQDVCPGVSYPTLQRGLAELKKSGEIRCLRRGPDAEWERIGG